MSPVCPHLRGTGTEACDEALAANRVQPPGQSTHPCHGRPCACHLGQKGTSLTDRDGRHKSGHDRRGSDSRLPESEHAMSRINIPQHSEGLTIAAERAVSLLKADIFQIVVVEARFLRRARHVYPPTEAVSGAIAEKRKFFVPKCERALVDEPHLVLGAVEGRDEAIREPASSLIGARLAAIDRGR
jgi:hypothetical protein